MRRKRFPLMLSQGFAPTFFLLLVICCVGGCGNANLASVTGQVTLDDKPVPNAFVKFFPTGMTGAPSFGKTDANGNYKMMFSDSEAGAWVGENAVQISTGDVGLAPGMGTPETIPVAYNTKSTLVETVKSGSNKFDFKLKSDAGKVMQIADPDAAPSRKK
ncbi:MAG: carboxypeptidase regulatory-like domain-containing protein [Pirellula sp.]